jgi:hypothetical protein
MARPKKSGASEPKPDHEPSSSDAHEAAENEGMAHVRPDELAGSPDIFAASTRKPEASSEPATASAAEPEAHADMEPEAAAEPEPEPKAAAEPEQAALEAHVEPEAASVATMPAPAAPPPAPDAQAPAAQPHRGGSGVALGIVLVVVGLFFLVVSLANVDLGAYAWPLFVIIPGLTLLIVGFVSLGTGAAIPGGILTMVGLVLAYQNSSGNWASWVYVWPLVAPGGVGVGLFLQGMRDRNQALIKQGRSLLLIAFLIFMIGFVFFESILHMTGTDYGLFGKAALPFLLVVIGVGLLIRSLQRSRRA